MISKKNAIIWIVMITVTCCFVTFMLTFYTVKNSRNAQGEIYISNDQYNLLMRYSDLNQVEQIVEKSFYKETDRDELLEGAKKGLLKSLDDPYSVYYTKEEFTSLFDKLDGVFTGLGIIINQDLADGLITVIHVYPDSPAFEAGLEVGDKITVVNNESIVGLNAESAAEKLRGPDGTKVTITFKRADNEMTKEITRRPVEIDKASYTMIDEDIGYINIFEFTGNCVDIFKEAINEMKKDEAKAVVIDLRNNPGGRVTFAKEICDLLLPEGVIVYTEDRAGNRINQESDASYWNVPIAVLVNKNSASASEIMAGAIQDFGRGKIIGEQTFGKGVVQDIISMPETGAGVKITTAVYYTPKGNNVNGVGITPDVEVLPAENDLDSEFTIQEDVQMQEAVKVLKAEIAK